MDSQENVAKDTRAAVRLVCGSDATAIRDKGNQVHEESSDGDSKKDEGRPEESRRGPRMIGGGGGLNGVCSRQVVFCEGVDKYATHQSGQDEGNKSCHESQDSDTILVSL